VAVVGAGHIRGISGQLAHPVEDLGSLEEVPKAGFGLWGWLLPVLVLALIATGFASGGQAHGWTMLGWWTAITMACTAIATTACLAHPVTVVVATLVAPLTTLHPALASGWFAGLSEAYLKKPRVGDFERIHEDVLTLGGWWRNPVTRILLVFFMSNLGSSVGVFIAAPVLARMAVGS
ncbi:MAG TPA: TraB family protein, partial [Deltaproteobacteria bacterium]|nr:TraB family protein [Deltaproteobacteria bacterium]